MNICRRYSDSFDTKVATIDQRHSIPANSQIMHKDDQCSSFANVIDSFATIVSTSNWSFFGSLVKVQRVAEEAVNSLADDLAGEGCFESRIGKWYLEQVMFLVQVMGPMDLEQVWLCQLAAADRIEHVNLPGIEMTASASSATPTEGQLHSQVTFPTFWRLATFDVNTLPVRTLRLSNLMNDFCCHLGSLESAELIWRLAQQDLGDREG